MKSTLKKMLALLLALVMVLGTLAACDTTEPQQTTDPNAGNQTQPKETDPVETDPVETEPEETEPEETEPEETDPEETEPSDPKDPSDTRKPKVGVIVTVGVLALSAASVIAAVVLPKKRNRKK